MTRGRGGRGVPVPPQGAAAPRLLQGALSTRVDPALGAELQKTPPLSVTSVGVAREAEGEPAGSAGPAGWGGGGLGHRAAGGLTLLPPPRMCAGSARRQEYGQEYGQEYRQEYRRCLEREFRRGRAGACSDPSFGERLRRRLRLEPALLGALQEDAPALLSRGLRGRPDPGLALPGLAGAFRLLELAAVNLYLFPWRKEFGTIQVRARGPGGAGRVLGRRVSPAVPPALVADLLRHLRPLAAPGAP